MKNNVFLSITFFYSLTMNVCSLAMEELSRFSDSTGSLEQKIVVHAAHQDPVNTIPNCALVRKSWAQAMQLPEIVSLKSQIINFNIVLRTKIVVRSLIEEEIMDYFKNPQFCVNIKFIGKETSFSFIDVLAFSYHYQALKTAALRNQEFFMNSFDQLFKQLCYHNRDECLFKIFDTMPHSLDVSQALCHAAQKHWSDGVKWLLKKGCDVNKIDSQGKTALFYALNCSESRQDRDRLSQNYVDTLKFLLQAGADQNMKIDGTKIHDLVYKYDDKDVQKLLWSILNHYQRAMVVYNPSEANS